MHAVQPQLHVLTGMQSMSVCGHLCGVVSTAAGAGHVGRGFASMPVQHLAEAGLASGLSTLAETAVVVSRPMLCCDTSPCMQHAVGVYCSNAQAAVLLRLPGM